MNAVKDPDKKQRKSLRLKGYDYSENGPYFVTICTKGKEFLFEKYPELKSIILDEWESLLDSFPTLITDAFVVMPNHIHGILFVMKKFDSVGATLEVAQEAGSNPAHTEVAHRAGSSLAPTKVAQKAGSSPAPTVGRIIGTFKSICVRKWAFYLAQGGAVLKESFWQRNYYDHIIRNEKELNSIREYIMFNPSKWLFDNENPHSVKDLDYITKWEWLEGR